MRTTAERGRAGSHDPQPSREVAHAAPDTAGTETAAPGRLYGADESFRAEEFRTPLENEPRQFRIIVSPEDGADLGLKEFTRQFMRQVENDTGRRPIWAFRLPHRPAISGAFGPLPGRVGPQCPVHRERQGDDPKKCGTNVVAGCTS